MADFQRLTPDALKALQAQVLEETLRRREADPVEHFPWHDKQQFLLDDAHGLFKNPVRTLLAIGGNRSGKSGVAKGAYARTMDRSAPWNRQFKTTDRFTGKIRGMTDTDPLRTWIVPPTGEKYREDWVNPADGMGVQFWLGDKFLHHRSAPEDVFISRPPGLTAEQCRGPDGKWNETICDRTIGKSQDQKLHTFEASEIHAAFVDEEPPDANKVRSIMMRLGTSNGILFMSFTPLLGLSWSYDLWYKPLIKQGRAKQVRDRCWIHVPTDIEVGAVIATQMHMADNPRAEVYAKEIIADPSFGEAEKAARIYGTYGFVEGALIEQLAGIDVQTPNREHEKYVVDAIPGRKYRDPVSGNFVKPLSDPLRWRLFADPNKSYGGLLTLLDTDGNLFIVREHLEESWANRRHADAFRQMMKEEATPGVPQEYYADPGSAGAQSIIDLEDFGLPFSAVQKGGGSVSRSIKKLRGLAYVDPKHRHPITGELGAPRLYFYRPGLVSTWTEGGVRITGCRIADQVSAARQREGAPPDTPDKDAKNKLDLFDCLRYAADMADAYGEDHEVGAGEIIRQSDRLPVDSLTLGQRQSIIHPIDQHVELPTYGWEESRW